MAEGFDHHDDPEPFRVPLPADDRVWRHPSELGALRDRPADRYDLPAPVPRRRGTLGVALVSGAVGAMATLALLSWTGAINPALSTSSTATTDAVVLESAGSTATGSPDGQAQPALDSVASIRPTDGGPATIGVFIDLRGHLVTAASTLPVDESYVVDCDGRRATDVIVLARDVRDDVAVLQLPTGIWPLAPISTRLPQRGDHIVAVTAGPDPVTTSTSTGRTGQPGEPGAMSTATAPITVTTVAARVEPPVVPDVRPGTIRGRSLTVDDPRLGPASRLLRSDAPGAVDDGGLLFDTSGNVVALLTARDDDVTDQFSYATPIAVVESVAHRIIAPSTGR